MMAILKWSVVVSYISAQLHENQNVCPKMGSKCVSPQENGKKDMIYFGMEWRTLFLGQHPQLATLEFSKKWVWLEIWVPQHNRWLMHVNPKQQSTTVVPWVKQGQKKSGPVGMWRTGKETNGAFQQNQTVPWWTSK